LDHEQAEVAHKACIDGEPDFASIFEVVFKLESFLVGTGKVGIDESILTVIVLFYFLVLPLREASVSSIEGILLAFMASKGIWISRVDLICFIGY
jgi:hypothetical protein